MAVRVTMAARAVTASCVAVVGRDEDKDLPSSAVPHRELVKFLVQHLQVGVQVRWLLYLPHD
jgi:hypothetical protein